MSETPEDQQVVKATEETSGATEVTEPGAAEPATEAADTSAEQEAPDLAKKVAEYEELFKHRYTMEDPRFAETVNRPKETPIIVTPWGSKPHRNFDYTRRGAEKRPYGEDNKRPYDQREFQDSKRRRYDNNDRGRQGGYEPYGRPSHHHRGGRGDFNNPYRNRHEVGSRGYNDDTGNRQPRSSYSGSHDRD